MASPSDTVRFTRRLEEVGVDQAQAVRHAELASVMVLADLVTTDHQDGRLRLLRAEVNADIATAKPEIVRTIVISQLATILIVLSNILSK